MNHLACQKVESAKCCRVVNVKAKNGSIQINARRARDILLVLLEIMLLILPFLFDIFHVFSSVAALLIGVLALLCEEEMRPNILSGESSGGQALQACP